VIVGPSVVLSIWTAVPAACIRQLWDYVYRANNPTRECNNRMSSEAGDFPRFVLRVRDRNRPGTLSDVFNFLDEIRAVSFVQRFLGLMSQVSVG
jgi:hypothetical protein